MSGIAGMINANGAPAEAARIQRMLAAMHRRAPDRRDAWVVGRAGLGQALLATTPEALAEHQPWVHPQSGCVVVSDSRLDNRPQLLAALGVDAAPDRVGDGELLHAAWQRWGRGCADQLRGDFAFAIWDPREQRLFAARDPMGVRPFYLHHAPGQRIVFASSADAVLAHGGIDRSLDEGRIADALVGETEGIDADGTMPLAAAVFHTASRQGVRAMMDGVPADNCFTTSGYDHALLRRGRWLAAWKVKRGYVAAFRAPGGSGLRALLRLSGGLLPSRLRALRQEQQVRHQAEGLVKDSLIDPDFARRVDLTDRVRRYRQNMAEHALLSSDARQQSSLGVAYITAGIERYNRVASHFGIEPRPPFADRDLIAFQARVPWHLRLREGRPKWVLRKAMQGLLPPDVAWRQGKEHLGRQYNAQLLRRLPGPMPALNSATAVARYLEPSALRQVPVLWDAAEGTNAGRLLRPVLLDLWLKDHPIQEKV